MMWKEKLHEMVEGEKSGSDAYMELAAAAEAEGCCHEAKILRDIAREEHQHEQFLREMM